MIEFYFSYLTANVGSAKLSQCALDEAERNEQIARVLSMGEQRFIDFLEGQIEAANARNEITLQSDPRTAARFLMVIIEGIKTKYLQFPDWPWAEVLKTARRGFFDGIFTAKGSS